MITKKQRLRTEAIQQICSDLKANVDTQDIVRAVGNDSRYEVLFAGKTTDQCENYIMSLISSAEQMIGWR